MGWEPGGMLVSGIGLDIDIGAAALGKFVDFSGEKSWEGSVEVN